MSDTPQHEAHRRPDTPPMAESFMEFDLPCEIHRLKAETTWSTVQNARTLVKYDDVRVALMALQAKVRVPNTRPRRGSPSTCCLATFKSGHPVEPSIFATAVCSPSTEACLMRSKHWKRALLFSQSHGRRRNQACHEGVRRHHGGNGLLNG